MPRFAVKIGKMSRTLKEEITPDLLKIPPAARHLLQATLLEPLPNFLFLESTGLSLSEFF